jgi:hypothetical protein
LLEHGNFRLQGCELGLETCSFALRRGAESLRTLLRLGRDPSSPPLRLKGNLSGTLLRLGDDVLRARFALGDQRIHFAGAQLKKLQPFAQQARCFCQPGGPLRGHSDP